MFFAMRYFIRLFTLHAVGFNSRMEGVDYISRVWKVLSPPPPPLKRMIEKSILETGSVTVLMWAVKTTIYSPHPNTATVIICETCF
jgi:hypothetical protein